MDITVYTTPTCPYCMQVKEYLKSRGLAFTEQDVTADPKAAEEMVRLSGQQGVPVTVVDGEVILGLDLSNLERVISAAQRPRLGAAIAWASDMAAQGRTTQQTGAYIGRVRPGGVAARAGLEPGDVITAFAGRQVRSAVHLEQLLAGVQPGARIPISYVRGQETHPATLVFE